MLIINILVFDQIVNSVKQEVRPEENFVIFLTILRSCCLQQTVKATSKAVTFISGIGKNKIN